MTAPSATYYEMLAERLPGHGEPVPELQARGILLDGSTANGEKRLLLQIFSQTLLGKNELSSSMAGPARTVLGLS